MCDNAAIFSIYYASNTMHQCIQHNQYVKNKKQHLIYSSEPVWTYLQLRQIDGQVKYSSGKKEHMLILSSEISPQNLLLNAWERAEQWSPVKRIFRNMLSGQITFSCVNVTCNCTVHGADLTYISLLVIFCIIVYVTNKKPWTLKVNTYMHTLTLKNCLGHLSHYRSKEW